MENRTISIIVPVYNREKHLERCIKSIVEQTYRNLEIILIDDGSTDSSLNICKKWANNDTRIMVIEKENGGVSSARNAGIDAASGEFIGFVDSDDYIEPEMYERLVEPFFENSKYEIQMTSCGLIRDGVAECIDKNTLFNKEDAFVLLFGHVRHFEAYVWNKLYLSKIIKRHNIRFAQTISIAEDARFNFDYFKYVERFYSVSYIGYNYNLNSSSATLNFNKNSKRYMSAGLSEYFINNSPSEKASQYILHWSVPQYRNIITEYYMGYSNEETYKYVKRKMKEYKKQYLKNDLLNKKEKIFVISVCDFSGLYKIYKKHSMQNKKQGG